MMNQLLNDGGWLLKALSSGAWSIFGTVSEKALTVVTYILVSREVPPEQFGYLIVVLLTMELFSYVASFGVRENIIRTKNCSSDFYGDCLYFIRIVAASLVLILVGIITPVSYYVAGVEVSSLYIYMALFPYFSCLNTFYQGILQRRMQFKALAIRRAGIAVFSGAVGIISVSNGQGVLSLIYAKYAYVLLDYIVLRYISRFRLESDFSVPGLFRIFSFGWKVSISQVMNFFSSKQTEFITVSFFGPQALAILDVGRKVLVTLYSVLMTAVAPVSLSVMTSTSAPMTAYHLVVRVLVVLLVPFVAIIGVNSEEIIDVVFGSKWNESASLLAIFSFGVMAQPISWHLQNICLNKGRPGLAIYLNLINLLVSASLLLYSAAVYGSLDSLVEFFVVGLFVSAIMKITFLCIVLKLRGLPFFMHFVESVCIFFSVFYLLPVIDAGDHIVNYFSVALPDWLLLFLTLFIHGLILLPYIIVRIFLLNSKLSELKGN